MASDMVPALKALLEHNYSRNGDTVNLYASVVKELIDRLERAEDSVEKVCQYIRDAEGYGDELDAEDIKKMIGMLV